LTIGAFAIGACKSPGNPAAKGRCHSIHKSERCQAPLIYKSGSIAYLSPQAKKIDVLVVCIKKHDYTMMSDVE
jgi:hypothetical protein